MFELGRLIEYGRRKDLKTKDSEWYQMVAESVDRRKPNRDPGGNPRRAKSDSRPKPPEFYISNLFSGETEEAERAKFQLLRAGSDVVPALIAYLKDVKGRHSLLHRSVVAELLAEMNDERALEVLRAIYAENIERLTDEMRPIKMREAKMFESAMNDINRISGQLGPAYVSPIQRYAQFGADLQAAIRRLTPATTKLEVGSKFDHSSHQYIWLFDSHGRVIGIWINDGFCDPEDPQLFIELALSEHKTLLVAEGVTLAECGFDDSVMDDLKCGNWMIQVADLAVRGDEMVIQGGMYVMLGAATVPHGADRHELRVSPGSMGLHPIGA